MAPQPNRFALDRFKTQLKLSINRLVLLQKKLTGQSLAARKDIAELLKANKVDQAFTKVSLLFQLIYYLFISFFYIFRLDILLGMILWLRLWKLYKVSVMIY